MEYHAMQQKFTRREVRGNEAYDAAGAARIDATPDDRKEYLSDCLAEEGSGQDLRCKI
jgi:hypothetical protein